MVKVENDSSNIIKILKGSVIAVIITLVLLIFFAILLTYTNINESVMPTVIIMITAISILIGGQITTKKIKQKGIFNGALVGIVYVSFIYLLSSIVTKNFSLNNYSIIMITTCVVIGGLGGIIGVNRK